MNASLSSFSRPIPKDQNHVANRLLAEGTFDSNMDSLRKGLHAIEIGVVFDRTVSRTGGPDRAAQEKKFSAAIAHLAKVAEQACTWCACPRSAPPTPNCAPRPRRS